MTNKFLTKLAELTEREREVIEQGRASPIGRAVGGAIGGGILGSFAPGKYSHLAAAGLGGAYGAYSGIKHNEKYDKVTDDESKIGDVKHLRREIADGRNKGRAVVGSVVGGGAGAVGGAVGGSVIGKKLFGAGSKGEAIGAGLGFVSGLAGGSLGGYHLIRDKKLEKQAGWDTVGRIIKRVGNTMGAKPGLRRGQMGPAAPKGFGDKVRGFGQDVLNDKGHARLAVGATGAALATGVVGGRLSKSNEPQQ